MHRFLIGRFNLKPSYKKRQNPGLYMIEYILLRYGFYPYIILLLKFYKRFQDRKKS